MVFSIPTIFTPKAFACFTKPKSGTFVKGCWISLFSLFLLGTAYGQNIEQSSQQDLIQFQISQLDAGNALNEFAKQARVQMLFDYEIAQNIRTNEVIGEYQVWEALQLLVLDTGLEAVQVDNSRYSVVSAVKNTEEIEKKVNTSKTKATLFAGIAAFFRSAMGPSTVIAQEQAVQLEEVVVTGRKREESLVDVPVSISVWSASSLIDQGILNQQDMFDATPGLSFDTATGDRNSSQPAVRGVQSNEIATTQQKVNSFIDGLPMLGQVGSLTFAGIEQVEIYRGPQSTAFGRSTFAGAINYVTADATEEFEAKAQARVSSLGSNELGLSISGPLGDKLGYRLSYIKDEFTGPDEWTSTDGFEMGTQETGTLNAKLNFQFSDTAYGEVMYTRLDQEDGAAAQWRLNPTNCSGDSGNFLFSMGARVQLTSGSWDCDINSDPLARNHDVLGQFTSQYNANIAAYTAAAPMVDANMDGTVQLNEFLGQTLADGQTYEQALIGQTVTPFAKTTRDRIQGEINFEVGDSLLTFLGMYNSEFYQRWIDLDGSGSLPVFAIDMISMMASLNMNVGSMSDPTDIEEKYLEARWTSSSEEKLRYNLGASYYSYDFQTDVYLNYGALANNLTLPNAMPVSPRRDLIISNSTENLGVSFGVQYDMSDRSTLSFEGRYQSDENCGADIVNNLTDCVTTKSFTPRLSINTTLSDSTSVYGQISQGTNPAGINITYSNPQFVQALQIASGAIISPFDGFTYNGTDGIHFPTAGYDADTYAAYDEETLTNFEIGAKGTFADGRGNYTVAAYYMLWEDLVSARDLDWDDTTANGWNVGNFSEATGNRTFLNAGDGEFYGIEIATSFAANDIWTIGGNLSLGSSTYKEFCSPSGPDYSNAMGQPLRPILTPAANGVEANCSTVDGNDIPRTSKLKGALHISAALPNDVMGMATSLRADYRWTGKHYTDDFNLIERAVVGTLNLSANIRSERLTLRFFVNNVLDEDEPLNLGFGNFYTDNVNPTIVPSQAAGWTVTPRRPREFGVTAVYDF